MSTNQSAKKESHVRSILKGISWRVIASLDTFLVAFFVTWIAFGEPNAKIGFAIAGFEFFLKLGIYYIYERIWQKAWKDGSVTQKETIIKTIVWRVVATATTFLISKFVLDKQETDVTTIALIIAIVETFTKLILYYFHERLWIKLPLGSVRSWFRK